MNNHTAAEILRRHNRWRRGDDTTEMVSPEVLGEAIETVCRVIESLEPAAVFMAGSYFERPRWSSKDSKKYPNGTIAYVIDDQRCQTCSGVHDVRTPCETDQ